MKIKFENVSFCYNNKLPYRKPILQDINLEINSNEFIGLVGPTGSGKTTLIQHFTGLLHPNKGKVLIDDLNLSEANIDIDSVRKKIGLVFQFPETQLFEETVYEDIAFGPKNFGFSDEELEESLKYTLDLFGLDLQKIKNRSPFKLSEGEKRKVALAGIIVMNPDVLIMDEPTACLDMDGIHKIEQLLITLHTSGKTIIIVSHNLDFVAKLCERIILLNKGKVCFDGPKDKFFKNENIMKMLDIEVPRIVRFSKRLFKLGYISNNIIFSADNIKQALKN